MRHNKTGDIFEEFAWLNSHLKLEDDWVPDWILVWIDMSHISLKNNKYNVINHEILSYKKIEKLVCNCHNMSFTTAKNIINCNLNLDFSLNME